MPDSDHALGYRVDPLTGEVAFIVAERQDRPNLPPTGCPFCVGGIEAPEPYDVFSFPNRWPAIPDARCEVVLYTPDHDATFWSLGRDGARKVIDLWAERSAALGARDDVAYVLVFENRGPEVGATIAHPHGQIYAFDVVPPRAAAELARDAAVALGPGAEGARAEGSSAAGPGAEGPGAEGPGAGSPGAGGGAAARLVCEHGGWRAWVPWAASWPYELVLAPAVAVADLPSLDDGGRDNLASTLVDVLERLDRLHDEAMPYMLWIHQRPFDGGDWPNAWLHVHIAPLHRAPGTPRFVAAGELGSEVYFNPVDPDRAAADLRAAGPEDRR